MNKVIKIGTRESQLAIWQANLVKNLLLQNGYNSKLVFIKTDGDIDLKTPLYAMGVQGVFTKSLDTALLNNTIDIAVHSMKDVPIQLPQEIVQTAVLKRGSYKDILVLKSKEKIALEYLNTSQIPISIATSSVRRKAQWLHRFPNHTIENLRGNVNSRLIKLSESNWYGAIFATAGLERINLRPHNAIDLDWMLPAPAQGAIMLVAKETNEFALKASNFLNHIETSICVKIERNFLQELHGGCSAPISALAQIKNNQVYFKGNILSPNGNKKLDIEIDCPLNKIENLGINAAIKIKKMGAAEIIEEIKNAAI